MIRLGPRGMDFYNMSLNDPMTTAYLDAATAAPLHPVAHQAFEAATAEGWADPGKLYRHGRTARQLLDAARQTIADAVGARADEVLFTGNGTQAVHAGILGALSTGARSGRTLVHSAVEHSSVLYAAQWHGDRGGHCETSVVDRLGRIQVDQLSRQLSENDCGLVAVQSANHEVGTIQPIRDVVAACGKVPLLVDAAQSLGRVDVPSGWSILTGSARKWGGPSGVGVLVIRKGTRWRTPWPHTHELDPGGSLHLPSVVAAAASLRAVMADRDRENARLHALTRRIREQTARIPYVDVVGDPHDRLPHIVTFSYPFEDGEPLLVALDAEGFSVSAGSACTSATLRPSHVLEEMGILSHGNIRVSLHHGTTEADVDGFVEALPRVVARLREEAGVADL